ncbi:hypothetical protein CI109_105064 [Kwoniella shandongensis]|uniref:DNA replication regulator Sld3 C-terminal domain-containing protein n=1 Tax=Kwoniella shandongensis TaxID=1734106 RepID=A0AAJ8MYN7_9TREE
MNQLKPLPFSLDLSCPVALPIKPLAGIAWPFPIAGSSTSPGEDLNSFVKRRYYETIYFPIIGESTPAQPSVIEIIKPLLLSLPHIETRHRKVLLPLLSGSGKKNDDVQLVEPELGVIRVALDLRISSRSALDDGVVQAPKRLADELEKRETLIQIILLLMYLSSGPSPPSENDGKKRKRHRHSRRADDDIPAVISPIDDPKTALELLMDRLSVWQAVSELGLDLNLGLGSGGIDEGRKSKSKGKGKEEENVVAAMLKSFWDEVLVPFFLHSQAEACASFHLKVFGQPIPSKLLATIPSTTKKPRKPKLTRARPSRDEIVPAPPSRREKDREAERISNRGGSSSRAVSRAPSDVGSRASPPPRESVGMKRTISRTSDTQSQSQSFRRSRSASMDPIARIDSASSAFGGHTHKKPLMRAPSGKDLFKGREVGLMRRTTSRKAEGLGREDSQGSGRFGLLGRKTSGGKESQSQSHNRRNSMEESQRPSTNANTLILATPSKPRQNMFAPRQSQWHNHPTPIREETPGSLSTPRPRPTFVAETPVAPGRIATNFTYSGMGGIDDDEDMGEESDDPLADLMVMTDDEDEPSGGSGRAMVPETPMK